MSPPKRPSFIQSFSRSQVSSTAASAVDFGLLFSLTELFHVWYVIAVACGSIAGAITNFLMNRHWSFVATDERWHTQAARYAVSSVGSLILNTGGVYLVTEYGHIHYSLSVLIVSLVVGFVYNYPLQKYWVFKHQP